MIRVPSRSPLFPYTTLFRSVRTKRPQYVDFLPPCNNACPAGEDIQGWLALAQEGRHFEAWERDRKSTRLNSSHVEISYAVFCLKKQSTSPWSHLVTSLCYVF